MHGFTYGDHKAEKYCNLLPQRTGTKLGKITENWRLGKVKGGWGWRVCARQRGRGDNSSDLLNDSSCSRLSSAYRRFFQTMVYEKIIWKQRIGQPQARLKTLSHREAPARYMTLTFEPWHSGGPPPFPLRYLDLHTNRKQRKETARPLR